MSAPQQPLPALPSLDDEARIALAQAFADRLQRRRSVRDFSDRAVPRAVIEQALRAACSAPSGANQQPWRFVAVGNPDLKRRIREAAEAEEREFYARRAPEEWLQALAPLGTDADKPFLETAPWLIAIFYERFGVDDGGEKHKRYYPHESTGIACGMLACVAQDAVLRAQALEMGAIEPVVQILRWVCQWRVLPPLLAPNNALVLQVRN